MINRFNKKGLLYINTIRRMTFGMMLSRLAGQRKISSGKKVRIESVRPIFLSSSSLDLNEEYLNRFDVNLLGDDVFLLINEKHHVDLNEWKVKEASHLWNFNLHYFEYGIALAAKYKKTNEEFWLHCFKRLVASWIDRCVYAKGDAWHPYTISLRLINWLIALDVFGEAIAADKSFMGKMYQSMYLQYKHLDNNQEKHLLGNHYFENLKTLLICSLLFDEKDVFQRIEKSFRRQLNEQILEDGVHYERSMMYHKLILEGLLRVSLAYKSVKKKTPEIIISKLQVMINAAASIEKGMGKTPFFNDAADGIAKETKQLADACMEVLNIAADDSLISFKNSGFYKLYDQNVAIVCFAGDPGPRYMLGHSHCDVLSYEMSVDNQPLMVNSGTFAYQSDLRSYFRSTEAHNTAMIFNEEQMECWGEHRVARGVKNVVVKQNNNQHLSAKYVTYGGKTHKRIIALNNKILKIQDNFQGKHLKVLSFIHLAPGVKAVLNNNEVLAQCGDLRFAVKSSSKMNLKPYIYSPEFGILDKSPSTIEISSKAGQISYFLKIVKHYEGSEITND